MAGEFDIDVQDGNDLGGFVVNDDGHFQVGGACCPSEPCSDCDYAQPSATGTVAPGDECDDATGIYDFIDHGGLPEDPLCYWEWWNSTCAAHVALFIFYFKASETWCARASAAFPCSAEFGGEDCEYDPPPLAHLKDITGNVQCIGQTLVGSFDLPGWNGPVGDCEGETLHIELNTP